MTPEVIAALSTAIVSIIGAITAAIVAVKAHNTASTTQENLSNHLAKPLDNPPNPN
jgi:hypothetical protein